MCVCVLFKMLIGHHTNIHRHTFKIIFVYNFILWSRREGNMSFKKLFPDNNRLPFYM